MSRGKNGVHGRVKNVEVGDRHLYTFEMYRPKPDLKAGKVVSGGVRYRRRHGRGWKTVDFSAIAEGCAKTYRVDGRDVEFLLTDGGLSVAVKGEGGPRLVPFSTLADFGRRQGTLL